MRLYLAGPMRGYEHYNFPRFREAADKLRRLGHHVICPAELDNAQGKNEYVDDLAGEEELYPAIRRDINAIMGVDGPKVDAIVTLDGWEASKGARCEVALAQWAGLPVYGVNSVPQ